MILELSGDLTGFRGWNQTSLYFFSNVFLHWWIPYTLSSPLNGTENYWRSQRYLADLMECTDCVQWHLLHKEALPGSVQNKPAVQSAGMSSERHLKKSEIGQIHTAFRLIKKWLFLAKSQASKEKKDCQLKIMCLSRGISIGTFLWITMTGRRFVSVYTTSKSSFLRSGSQNGIVAYMRFTLNKSAAK